MKTTLNVSRVAAVATTCWLASAAWAQGNGAPELPASGTGLTVLALQGWMSTEVGDAWAQGYKGQGATITVVDDFKSNQGLYGNLSGSTQLLRHGEWTFKESSLIAPSATMRAVDFGTGRSLTLAKGLNAFNLSYGMYAAAGYSTVRWSAQESSLIGFARDGKAVISKAAGNDSGTAVGQANSAGKVDYLARDLIGRPTAIFVGALDRNGTVDAKATIASYSNIAGSNATVQKQFLMVGVAGSQTGLYGTSFAAPVVTAYAAVVGSKFTKATPLQVTNQLLNTARQDTINNYSVSVHGRGEASLTRALAPASIN